MTVIIKPINKTQLMNDSPYYTYREFEDVESIDDNSYPLIKIRHKSQKYYVLMKVPDNCYLLVIKEDNDEN